MSPLFIKTILNVACCPCDPPHNGSPAAMEALAAMLVEGLVEECAKQIVGDGQITNGLQLTEKGLVYVEALQSVPLPVTRHVIEWPEAT